MLNTDIFLKIGDSHKVCEDYIIQGSTPVPFIILSDGCSSSNNTEMGARILCHLAKQYLQYRGDNLYDIDYHKMGNWIIHNAELTARQLGLKISCLDATLIVSYELDGTVFVHMYGDGAVVVKYTDGFIQVDRMEFTNNAPYYLSYLIDEYRDEVYHLNNNEKTYYIDFSDGRMPFSQMMAYDCKMTFSFSLTTNPTIFICSDGIESFIKKDPSQRDILKPLEVLMDFMAFKNVKGEFLKRRMKKALKNLDNQGITHYDDLSIGAYTRT